MNTFLDLPLFLQILIGSIAFLFAAIIVAISIAIFCAALNTFVLCIGSLRANIKGKGKSKTWNVLDKPQE